MVIGMISVSQGLDDAQKKVLAPLTSVGTDIVVTRTQRHDYRGGEHVDDHDHEPEAAGGVRRAGRWAGGFFAGGGGRNGRNS